MLNAVLLLFLHQTRLSKICFYSVVKISLKFIAIVNFQHTILSCFTFTAACLFYLLFLMEAVAL